MSQMLIIANFNCTLLS